MLSPIKAARSKINQIIGIQPRNKLTWYILFAFLLSAATLDGRKYMKNKNHNPKIISIKTLITERIEASSAKAFFITYPEPFSVSISTHSPCS